MNFLNLNRRKILMVTVLCFGLVIMTTKVYAALTLNATTITSDGTLTLTPATNVVMNGNVGIGTNNPTALFQVNQPTTGPGLVSVSAGSNVITGISTQFLSTIGLSDQLTIVTSSGSETIDYIASIDSNTSMTVEPAFTGSASNVAYTIIGGDKFSVFRNGDINIGGTNGVGSLFPGFGFLYIRTRAGTGFQPKILFQDLTFASKAMNLSFVTDGTTAGTRMDTVSSAGVPLFTLAESGNVGINTTGPTELLDINSDNLRIRTAKTPASATAPCDQGEISWDASFVYVCVATNTWKRSAITTW